MTSKLKNMIEAVFDEDFESVETASTFSEIESWDSLNYIRLVVAIQAEFGIELTAQEIQQIKSIPAIRKILKARGLDS
jgi:acyl carrier protein